MSLASDPPPESNRQPSGLALAAAALLWLAFCYLWILPLFRPRGFYFWGHYKLRDLYLGIPIALLAAAVTAVLLAPPAARRPLALRLTTLVVSTLLAMAAFDAAYTLGYMRAGKPDYWFDVAGVSHKESLPDPELGYVRRPGVNWAGRKNRFSYPMRYHTDAHGFRNPDGIKQADLLFLGDSFTEAAEVPEEATFVRRIATASGLSAVNLGRSGYGPQQELGVLRRYGLDYHPKVVVWQWYEGNDLLDAQHFLEWERNPNRPTTPFLRRYLDNSLLNQLFSRTLPEDYLPEPDRVPVTLHHPDGTETRFALLKRYVPDQPARYPEGLRETRLVLSEGARLCRAHHARLLVVFFPTILRALSEGITFDRPADRDRFLPAGKTDDPQDFDALTGRTCRSVGGAYLDMVPIYRARARADNRHLYLIGDEHLDLEGHAVAAGAILDWLRAHGLASSAAPRPGSR